jgi:5-methylcytosine-specific restriction endonuclease McrA
MKLEDQGKCHSCEYTTINKKSLSNHIRFGCKANVDWHKDDYIKRKQYYLDKSKKRYEIKKEEINHKRRERYAKNPDKEKKIVSIYVNTPKGKAMSKARWHRYRTQKSKGNVTTEQIQLLFENNRLCKKCSSSEYLEIDHVQPLSKGGLHIIENLQILCRKCNRSKGAKICLL